MLDSLKETALWSVSTGTLAGLYFGIQTQEYNFPIYKFAHLQIYRFSNCPSLCGLLIYLCTLPYDSSGRYGTPAILCAPLILSADAVLWGMRLASSKSRTLSFLASFCAAGAPPPYLIPFGYRWTTTRAASSPNNVVPTQRPAGFFSCPIEGQEKNSSSLYASPANHIALPQCD